MSADAPYGEALLRGEIARYRRTMNDFRRRQEQRGKELQAAGAEGDQITDDPTWIYLGAARDACAMILGALRRGGTPAEVAIEAAHLARLEEELATLPRKEGAARTAAKRRKNADDILTQWRPVFEELRSAGYGPEKARTIIHAMMKNEGVHRSERWLQQHLR